MRRIKDPWQSTTVFSCAISRHLTCNLFVEDWCASLNGWRIPLSDRANGAAGMLRVWLIAKCPGKTSACAVGLGEVWRVEQCTAPIRAKTRHAVDPQSCRHGAMTQRTVVTFAEATLADRDSWSLRVQAIRAMREAASCMSISTVEIDVPLALDVTVTPGYAQRGPERRADHLRPLGLVSAPPARYFGGTEEMAADRQRPRHPLAGHRRGHQRRRLAGRQTLRRKSNVL